MGILPAFLKFISLLRFAAEFCSESPLWRLHAAHVLFMRGDKYKEAAAFYEPIVRQNYGDILSVSAAVLGECFKMENPMKIQLNLEFAYSNVFSREFVRVIHNDITK